MTDRFDADAIVIGSGFGGAVAAARLAQAGLSVIVIERGRRWQLGTFPRTPDLDDGWLWNVKQGLYEIRWLGRMSSVQAAGWGGGSLVYANVFARPFDEQLDDRWAPHLRRKELDPYYDLAAHMVGVSPVAEDPRTGELPPRTRLVEGLTQDLNMAKGTVRPNLAVTFGDPESWQPNVHGVPRRGCAFVGECVIGCNHGAKNTLDYTYLAVAEMHAARAVLDAEVQRIEPLDHGYAVFASTPTAPGAALRSWTAPKVVLAAGAVATTELLLRSRDVHGTLPGLSPQLGRGFSGNGDFLTMAELKTSEHDMTTGPTITTNTVMDFPEGRSSVWYQVQDGAVPVALYNLLDTVLPAQKVRAWWRRKVKRTSPGQMFSVLAMGKDSGNGELRLDRKGRATLVWRNQWQAHLYRSQRRVGPLVAGQLSARTYQPLLWSVLRRTVTVHPLGGVRPGPDSATSVVDEAGEVHGYPGLYVMDGAVLPAATGVNPSATILAVAERSVEIMIRRSGRPEWRAPEWTAVTPTDIPEDAAFTFMSERHASAKGDGLTFQERMATRPYRAPNVAMSLAAQIPSMDHFLSDPAHELSMNGVIDVRGVATQASVTGTLSIFPDGSNEAMSYALRFQDDRGRPWQLSGTKTVRSRTPLALLTGLTNLRTEIAPVGSGPEEVQYVVLSIGARDLARLGTSLRGVGFTRARRARAVTRFATFFASSALRR